MGIREETTDIIQNFYPKLKEVEIDLALTKQDVSTKKSKPFRGDLWISKVPNNNKNWEENIIALIEAKSIQCKLDDRDWNKAKSDGQKKARKQELPYFIVTNTNDLIRFYNTETLKEIKIDSEIVISMQPLNVLQKLYTQISGTNNIIKLKIFFKKALYTEKDFQKTLFQLKNIYRMSKIDNDSEMINTTIGFVVLKYISEKEKHQRTLDKNIMLWGDFRSEQMHRDILFSIEDITKSSLYCDFKEALTIHPSLTAKHCQNIHSELSKYTFHGCGFDIYGAIYEAYADKKTKKEFGQYYTRRHITQAISKILLKNETKPRNIKICDPACGTGGFLTESFKALEVNYMKTNTLTKEAEKALRDNVIYGYDIKPKNVALAKLNMFLAGDGHTNIKYTDDSLIYLKENEYDYILTNPPYGIYKGAAEIKKFTFANISRTEFLFIEKIVKALKEGGEAAVIVPDGVLEAPTREKFRIKLLQHVTIKAIISLHEYVFRPYTTEKTYILFLQRKHKSEVGKFQKQSIWMYILENDGFQKGDKRYEIRENDLPDLIQNFLDRKVKGQNKFVKMNEINTDNFHNLLVEYYIPQGESKLIEVNLSDFKKSIKKLEDINYILTRIKK